MDISRGYDGIYSATNIYDKVNLNLGYRWI